jgi:3-isopropylmalate/(R)-2-methylmalate dehydratase large subunit
MGRTFIEKLISAHAGREVSAGDEISIEVDLRTARDAGGAGVVDHYTTHWPGQAVDDPARTCFTFDCAGAGGSEEATHQQLCRRFARDQGITVFDVNRGIGTHIAIDEGLALPGHTVVGTDSHLNLLGAIGALGLGLEPPAVAEAFRSGRTLVLVPETMTIRLTGAPGPLATAKDIALEVVRVVGSGGAQGLAIEYRGPVVEGFDLDQRITLASLTTEMGGLTAWIPPDDRLKTRMARLAGGGEPRYHQPDPDAVHRKEIEVDIEGLGPKVALPGGPDRVRNVAEVAGTKIDTAFIGSCTNGRDSDLELAARVVGERSIHRETLLTVVPSTAGVFGRLWTNGTLRRLFEAGAVIRNPGCGGCAPGQAGTTGAHEVQVSSANRNFHGPQGRGETFLASPATVAASALAGVITMPPEIAGAQHGA